jgi:K+ transporter
MFKLILLFIATFLGLYVGGVTSPFPTIFIFAPTEEESRQLWLNDLLMYLFVSSVSAIFSFFTSLLLKLQVKYSIYCCLTVFVVFFALVCIREQSFFAITIERVIAYFIPIIVLVLADRINIKYLGDKSARKHV